MCWSTETGCLPATQLRKQRNEKRPPQNPIKTVLQATAHRPTRRKASW